MPRSNCCPLLSLRLTQQVGLGCVSLALTQRHSTRDVQQLPAGISAACLILVHSMTLLKSTIDTLFSDGLELTSFYTYKVCAPARASFLTGRYPYKLAATKTNFAYFWTLEGTNTTLHYTVQTQTLNLYDALYTRSTSNRRKCKVRNTQVIIGVYGRWALMMVDRYFYYHEIRKWST